MPIFASSDQFYACAEALFSRLQNEYPTAAADVLGARLLIRLRCSEPVAEILINGRRPTVDIAFGPVKLRPELDVELATDTLHRILLGELSLAKALASRQLKVRGPAWKTMALAELFNHTQTLYPQVLHDQGLRF